MTRLTWDAVGVRYYETGIDRGVLYVANQYGVAWPGLVSVSETPSGGEVTSHYMDGVKYLNVASSTEFEANLSAFSSPPEFGPCEGIKSMMNGLFITGQPRTPFGLSYRTRVGNDVDGPDHAYKIHLVYNATAVPASRRYKSFNDSEVSDALSWDITTLPDPLVGEKPRGHMVVDSRKISATARSSIESALYGTVDTAARLPTAQEIAVMSNG